MDNSTPERGLSGVVTFGGGAKISAVAEQAHRTMPHTVSRCCRCLAAAVLLAAVAPCLADDVHNSADGLQSIAIALCSGDRAKLPPCKDGSFNRLARDVDDAAKNALAKAHPVTVPLLKRDQVWFREMIEDAVDDAADGGDDQRELQKRILNDAVATLQQRTVMLRAIAQGFGRAGVAGRWTNTFGTVEITPAGDDAFHLVLSNKASYGESDDNRQQTCKADAAVRLGADGWLSGDAIAIGNTAAAQTSAKKPALVKIRRQGDSLRVLAGDEIHSQANSDSFNCRSANQLTASYFAIGTTPVADGHPAAAPFVSPTFDCAHPDTAADEEICADPDLAANDVRLNQAWKRLLPRLDATTRRLLTEDQRAWAKSQPERYTTMLHPAWAKQTNFVHWTALARDNLADLQRERIAGLEGFDEKRRGYEGDWWAYDARLTVTRNKDGTLSADGNKWFEDDYKGGCDYDFSGRTDGDVFHPDDKSSNPDTMERDHATLVVNRTDDEWAKRRVEPNGKLRPDAGDGKCKRSRSISSTARLFPVRPSPGRGVSAR
jgi:uncharacterized protein YecT (DUF1311 family)